jgi:hypothetical protein
MCLTATLSPLASTQFWPWFKHRVVARRRLERDGFRLNRHRALDLWWGMIFTENRYPLFRIML